MGLRRRGRPRAAPAVERPGPLRVDRWHGDVVIRRALGRQHRHPPDPGHARRTRRRAGPRHVRPRRCSRAGSRPLTRGRRYHPAAMDAPPAPAWFTAAIAAEPEERTVRVKACDIHYLRWGDVERPGLVLVHGGAAHAHWWSFIAPLLLPQHHVVAVDLSGHGDSGRRPVYAVETWADEVMACADDSGMQGPPGRVDHSMVGLVTIP